MSDRDLMARAYDAFCSGPLRLAADDIERMVAHLRAHPSELADWRSCYQGIADAYGKTVAEVAPKWIRPLLEETR